MLCYKNTYNYFGAIWEPRRNLPSLESRRMPCSYTTAKMMESRAGTPLGDANWIEIKWTAQPQVPEELQRFHWKILTILASAMFSGWRNGAVLHQFKGHPHNKHTEWVGENVTWLLRILWSGLFMCNPWRCRILEESEICLNVFTFVETTF